MNATLDDPAFDEALRACLARALPGAGPPQHIRPLAGGWSNAVFAVRLDDRDLIVRLARIHEPEPLGIDRVREAAVLDQVAQAGLSPAPLYVDTARGELVLPDVGAAALSQRTIDDQLITAIGAALRRMHVLPCPQPPAFDPLAYARLHLARAARLGFHPPASIESLLLTLRMPSPSMLRFTHNDLNPDNLLISDRVWIVDWELAAPGNAALDLVTLSETCALDARQEQLLFAASGMAPPAPAEREQHRLRHALRQYAWALARRATGHATEEVIEQERQSAQMLGER